MRRHNPPHPGSVLREYLGPVSVTDAAKHLRVTRVALSRLLNGSAGISAEMALRLSDALGTTPELWTGMQAQYDLWRASRRPRKKIARLGAGRSSAEPVMRSPARREDQPNVGNNTMSSLGTDSRG